jgi:hypothetical protein
MSVQQRDAEPRDLSEPIELRPAETELVAEAARRCRYTRRVASFWSQTHGNRQPHSP